MPERIPHAIFSKKRQAQILHASLRFSTLLGQMCKDTISR